jgi:periplasmic protein TonB
MTTLVYENLALSWRPEGKTDHTFNIIFIITLAVFAVAGILASAVQLPVEKRPERIVISERVANFITEKPKPKVIEQPKPPEVVVPKITRPKPEERKPLTKVEKQAREKVKNTGLLALQKELASLANTADVNTMVNQKITKGGAEASAATVNTNILTANAGTGSGGVNDNRYVASVGQTKLEQGGQGVATTLQNTAVANKPKPSASGGKAGSGGYSRTEEDIANVIDQHKGVLHSLFRRASRNKPGLKGKIVLEITVLPSGKVAKIVVKSSELHDASLEESIIARIKLFDFGVRKGEALTVTVPVEFLPS